MIKQSELVTDRIINKNENKQNHLILLPEFTNFLCRWIGIFIIANSV